ncbi:MAG: DUF2778 domain-containing protein, partial [Methylocapsa sp.]|nr:DUF2778 domain-containing protein [Methylocapsa sp.]
MAQIGGHPSSRVSSFTVPGSAALASSIAFGIWTLYMHPATPRALNAPASRAIATAATIASNPYGALVDLRLAASSNPVALTQSFPLVASLESAAPDPSSMTAQIESAAPGPVPAPARHVANIPLPVPRPAEFEPLERFNPSPTSGRRFAVQQSRKSSLANASPDNRSFFEKLFGIGQPPAAALAYAAPESSAFGNIRNITASSPSPRYDRQTAVYDIAAHTVYLPDGTRLEAHSGLGSRLDDPRYVSERMRGATPPNVYELRPREQLFHGVQALRLIPVGNGELYGRAGLLAHTYMLGSNGDSNGCVSFKNYSAFLQAYQKGEIK